MGLFDFIHKKSASPLQKHAARVADKRALGPDRWESIQALIKVDSVESTEALLPRFTFYSDPSITDQEEKEMVFNAILSRGASSVEPLKRFIVKAESLSWPLKMLERLLPSDEVLAVLLELLSKMDTEYERDPQRKLQVLAELEARRGPNVTKAVTPFFRDVNESARFHAIGGAFAQDDAESVREELTSLLAKEESMRVKVRLLEGFAQRGWAVDPGQVGPLPDGFYLDAGIAKRR